jgi:hypothetical protein
MRLCAVFEFARSINFFHMAGVYGIHYVHLEFEQTRHIWQAQVALRLPVVPDLIILNALFMQIELRQKVVNACETNLELGFSHYVVVGRRFHRNLLA